MFVIIAKISWLVWSIMAVIFLAGFYLSYKAVLIRSQADFIPPIIFQLIGGLMVIPLIFASHQPLPFLDIGTKGRYELDYKTLGIFLLASVFYAFHDRVQATVRKHLDVAVAQVIDLSVHIFLILLGFIILREKAVLQIVLGILLIIMANFNIIYDFKSHEVNKYWFWGIAANLAYATGIFIDINLSKGRNLPAYVVLSYLWGAWMVFILSKTHLELSFKQMGSLILQDINRQTWLFHLLTSFFSVFYTMIMLQAYRVGPVSLTTAIISTTVIFNTLLSAWLLGENDRLLIKLLSASIGVIGLILIVVDV